MRPDVVSCTALVAALGADGQWQRAERVVAWMLQVCVCMVLRFTGLLLQVVFAFVYALQHVDAQLGVVLCRSRCGCLRPAGCGVR